MKIEIWKHGDDPELDHIYYTYCRYSQMQGSSSSIPNTPEFVLPNVSELKAKLDWTPNYVVYMGFIFEKRIPGSYSYSELQEWLEENKLKYFMYDSCCVEFENYNDALLFKLAWSK